MRLPKEIVNVVGIIAVTVVLTLGALLVAWPMFQQAGATSAQADQVAQTNVTSQAQLEALTTAKGKLSATEASVKALQTRIPAAEDMDGVFELIGDAASSVGATQVSVERGDSVAYGTRSAKDAQANGSPSAAPTPAPTAGASTDGTSTGTGTDGTSAGGTTASAQAPATGRTRIPVTITVAVPSATIAAAFLDALAVGPRIVTVDHSVLDSKSDQSTHSMTLTVTAFAYAATKG